MANRRRQQPYIYYGVVFFVFLSLNDGCLQGGKPNLVRPNHGAACPRPTPTPWAMTRDGAVVLAARPHPDAPGRGPLVWALFGFPIISIAHDSREKNLTCMEY